MNNSKLSFKEMFVSLFNYFQYAELIARSPKPREKNTNGSTFCINWETINQLHDKSTRDAFLNKLRTIMWSSKLPILS